MNNTSGMHTNTHMQGQNHPAQAHARARARTVHYYMKRHPAQTTQWKVSDLCKAYNFPTGMKGRGVIAIIELGGGWLQSDMEEYFKSNNQPMPTITDVSVDGTQNNPGVSDADGEVTLDIQVAADAFFQCTGETAEIRVYWASDIAPGIEAAANDGCDVFSCSWGADENVWGATGLQQLEAVAAAATAKGMVVLSASGDNDADDGGGTLGVDAPASCPHVLGVGGTNKPAQGTETVWNNNPNMSDGEGTGGGYSLEFPVQSWQVGAPPPPAHSRRGRMVPDVCADADPQTGYLIFLQGQWQVIGGTSAATPLWGGLLASLGEKLGYINSILWQNPKCFTDITQGNNGAYHAGPGPDACTGMGSPNGKALATLLAKP